MRAPAGMIWSVVILSPTLRVTSPSRRSGRGPFSGGLPMLGPRTIWTDAAFPGGAGSRIMQSSTRKASGMATAGKSILRSRGSVTAPATAAAAAVSGLTR